MTRLDLTFIQSKVQKCIGVLCALIAISNADAQEKFIFFLNQSSQVQKCINVLCILTSISNGDVQDKFLFDLNQVKSSQIKSQVT
jgi:hypothetical protein